MMMKRFQIGRVALLSGCAFAGIVAPAHAQSAATAANATPAADAAAPSAQDIIVTGTRVVRDGYNQPTPVTVAPSTELEKATPTVLVLPLASDVQQQVESTLFGHERGAFTGAHRQQLGKFELASGGTLFLDEIGEMSLTMQVKLLRAIQERNIVRVGGETPIQVDVRLICATHRDLKEMVEKGAFREDLYYRIHVIRLRIPPLRERKEDILWFTQLFLKQCAQLSTENHVISPSAERALLEYDWPGNLRELKHGVERACILSPSPMLEADSFFDDDALPAQSQEGMPETNMLDTTLADHLRNSERRFILQSLESHAWHFGNTAGALGISRKNLWEKMKKLDIHADKDRESEN